MIEPEPFWPSLQCEFGRIIRHPLERSTGTLTANLGALGLKFESEYVSDSRASCHERLSIYNRQYWFRLFSVMQQEFPLVAHLLGFWEFNGWVSDFLSALTPHSIDIAAIGDGFVNFLAAEAPRRLQCQAPTPALLLQAGAVDEAFRRIFRAPTVTAWHPDATEVARLPHASLRIAPNVALVREDWPLIELRDACSPDDEGPFTPFDALERPNHWALMRTLTGIGRVSLEAREYELFVAIQTRPLECVFDDLQRRTPRDEIAALSSQVNRWLARSMQLGFWVGLEEPGSLGISR